MGTGVFVLFLFLRFCSKFKLFSNIKIKTKGSDDCGWNSRLKAEVIKQIFPVSLKNSFSQYYFSPTSKGCLFLKNILNYRLS